ncbi:hypothetical protein BDW62DRAFT_76872 [Aspergillus aurantiobrunneus]
MAPAYHETPDPAGGDASLIALAHMPQQVHVWAPGDDWTGVVDRRERRKLQNRQNQRKWRQRRKANTRASPTGTEVSGTSSASSSTLSVVDSNPHHTDAKHGDLTCAFAPPNAREYRRWFEATVHQSYLAGSPQIEHLIGLTRLNVHHAINENIRAIGMDIEYLCTDDSLSIFNIAAPHRTYSIDKIPASLRPTQIQRTMPHHPWLDFFPFPRMRDIVIAAAHLFDDDELCHDLMAFWDTRNTGATLVVWGQSWDPRNWEVSESFAAKWGWLLRGSPELLVSTNYWRRRRGEEPLVWRRVLGGVVG